MSCRPIQRRPRLPRAALRPALTELQLPGNLIELSPRWLAGTKALERRAEAMALPRPEPQRHRRRHAQLRLPRRPQRRRPLRRHPLSFLGFDELTRFPELALPAHVPRPPPTNRPPRKAMPAPRRHPPRRRPRPVRSATNPGGATPRMGRDSLRRPETRRADGAIFLPSRLGGQPAPRPRRLRRELAHLPRAERERLVERRLGDPRRRRALPARMVPDHRTRRAPDRHARSATGTSPAPNPAAGNPDPDWTVGLRLDSTRQQGSSTSPTSSAPAKHPARSNSSSPRPPTGRPRRADRDRRGTRRLRQSVTDRYKRHILRGYSSAATAPPAPRTSAPTPSPPPPKTASSGSSADRNTDAFLDELTAFPNGRHDDCVDALAGAHTTSPDKHSHAGCAPTFPRAASRIGRRTGGSAAITSPSKPCLIGRL